MTTKTLELVKAGHTFRVRYEVGSEQIVLDELAAMVKRDDLPFDWFSAAVMSHQLGQNISEEMKTLLPESGGTT